jgi:hypothetical protein
MNKVTVTVTNVATKKGTDEGWDDLEGNIFKYWETVHSTPDSTTWIGPEYLLERFILFINHQFKKLLYERLISSYTINDTVYKLKFTINDNECNNSDSESEDYDIGRNE